MELDGAEGDHYFFVLLESNELKPFTVCLNAMKAGPFWLQVLPQFPIRFSPLVLDRFMLTFKVFILASILSRGGRFFLVAGTIQLIGPQVKRFLEEYFDVLTLVIVIVVALGYYIARLVSRDISGSKSA